MKPPSLDFFEMLRVLSEHDIDYIVVGGVCAVFHGAPVTTYDLDVVRSCQPENVERLLCALEELDGHSRLHRDQKLRPDKSHLEASGHLLLQTRYGHLDLLATIGSGRDYRALEKHTTTGTIHGVSFRLLNLETLILTKEEAGRDKDRMVLPILRATLNEKRKTELSRD